MTDKDVGELWKRHIDNHDYYEESCAEYIIELICKLVEERAARVVRDFPQSDGTSKALRDFGIPEKEYYEAFRCS